MRFLFLAALVLVLTACGGGEEGGEQPNETQQLLSQYVECMRNNGVQLPDPVEGDAGSVYEGVDQETPAFLQADKVCEPILQGVVADRQQQGGQDAEQQHDEMLALAECLREHGIDVADPVPGAEKPFGDSLDRTDPAVAKALEECVR